MAEAKSNATTNSGRTGGNRGLYISFLVSFVLTSHLIWSSTTMEASIAPFFFGGSLPSNETSTANKSLESLVMDATPLTEVVLPSKSSTFWPDALPPREYFDNCPNDSIGRLYTPPNKQQYFDDYYHSHPNFALITIAMSNRFADMSNLVNSVRRRGEWGGHIIIVTDQETLAAQYNYTTDLVPKDDKYNHLHDNVTVFVVKEKDIRRKLKKTLPYKRFKTQTLEFLDERPDLFSNIEYLVFIDADIVVGDSMAPFFDHIKESYEKPAQPRRPLQENQEESRMLMFEEQHPHVMKKRYVNDTIFHGGIIALKRDTSQGCLTHWRKQIDENRWGRDMMSLAELQYADWNQHLQPKCNVYELNKKYLKIKNLGVQGKSGVIVHITDANKKQIKHEQLVLTEYLKCTILL